LDVEHFGEECEAVVKHMLEKLVKGARFGFLVHCEALVMLCISESDVSLNGTPKPPFVHQDLTLEKVLSAVLCVRLDFDCCQALYWRILCDVLRTVKVNTLIRPSSSFTR